MITPIVFGGVPKLLSLSKAGTTSITVPANRIYHFAWLALNYVADATVTNRTVLLRLTLVNTAVCYILTSGTITASQTKMQVWNITGNITTSGPNATDLGTVGNPLTLYPAHKLDVTGTALQAGDTWTIEGIYYEVPISCP